jgi:hypothetical protein
MRPGAHWNATFIVCYSFLVRLAALHRLSRDLRMGWQQRSFSAIFSRHQCTRSLEKQLSGVLRRGFHWYAWLARYLQKRGYLQNTHNIYLWRQGLSAISPGHPTNATVCMQDLPSVLVAFGSPCLLLAVGSCCFSLFRSVSVAARHLLLGQLWSLRLPLGFLLACHFLSFNPPCRFVTRTGLQCSPSFADIFCCVMGHSSTGTGLVTNHTL